MGDNFSTDGYSEVDPNTYAEGLKNALDIKGVVNAPGRIDVDSIKYIADAIQSGFAIKTLRVIEQADQLGGGSPNTTINLFDPTNNSPLGFNNRLFETRLIGMDIILSNVVPVNLERINATIGHTLIGSNVTRMVNTDWEKRQETGNTTYVWTFPSMNRQIDNDNVHFSANWWNGYILPDQLVDVDISRITNWNGSEQYTIKYMFYTVPRGAQLPL